ncbi:MAG: T9SS type A sorting domain-containing protein [Cytophagales bacterium]
MIKNVCCCLKEPIISKKAIFLAMFYVMSSVVNLGLAQANKTTKAAPNAIGTAGNETSVANITYMWTIGEVIVFTGTDPTGFATQGFHQPMICKAFPTIVALNQTSCSLPYSLSVVNGFDKYLWKIGKSTIANAAGSNYNPVSNGNYSVTIMDSTGCSLSSSSISVDMSGKNIIPTISVYGTATKDTLLESSEAFSYQWYVITNSDGVQRAIVGETNKYYVPLYNGTYFVKINTEEYCVAYSSFYVVNNAGFEQINKYDFNKSDSTISISTFKKKLARNLSIFPIPSKDKVNIEYQSPENNLVTFNFYDVKGTLVDSKQMASKDGKLNMVYENASLPTGKYLLRVEDGNAKIDKSLIFE